MSPTYYANTNGMIACPSHMGYAGKAAYEANSNADIIDTDLTTWVRIDAADLNEIREFQPAICEHC
jgi:hypothetical protein